MSYFSDIINATKTLLTGMKITGKYFFVNIFTRKDVITQQYPNNINELEMFDRFRGEITLYHNEKNQHKCDACTLCVSACPNGSLEVFGDKETDPETGKPKRYLVKHIYHLEMCTMCGLCIEACPQDALKWGQDFHHVQYDRGKLTKVLNKPGSTMMPKEKKQNKTK